MLLFIFVLFWPQSMKMSSQDEEQWVLADSIENLIKSSSHLRLYWNSKT